MGNSPVKASTNSLFSLTDRLLRQTIHVLFLTLFFFLPLIFWIPNSEVFELPKIYFVYTMTTLISGLWLARMVVRREIVVKRTPLDIPVLLFLISQIASTIYSIDPHVSWFGWYGRFNGGLVSTISYTLLYYAFVSNYNSPLSLPVVGSRFSVFSFKSIGHRSAGPKPINRKPTDQNLTTDNGKLITAILASAAIVSLYAIFQHFGIDRDFWVQDVATRVFSTQGQPNWLAGYIVALIFIPVSKLLNFQFSIFPPAWTSSMRSRAGNFQSIFNFLIFNLLFLALLFTKSRSGLLGFAVADIVFWSAILVNRFNSSSRVRSKTTNREIQRSDWNISIASARFLGFARNDGRHFLTIHLLMATLVLATNNPIRETLFKNEIATSSADWRTPRNDGIPLKSELGGTESGDIRKIVWNGAVELVKQRPVFGFGPETFGLTYWQIRPKEHNLTSEWNFLYNKAHNEWLNLAANTGLFGLGTHLLLLGWFTVWALLSVFRSRLSDSGYPVFQSIRLANRKPTDLKLKTDNRELITVAILAALLGVEAVNFFGFSTVTTETYRYLFMGIAVVIRSNEKKVMSNEQKQHKKNPLLSTFYFLLICFATFYLLSQISRLYVADLKYNLGRQFYGAGIVSESLDPLFQAVNLVPNEPVFRNELAESLSIAALSAWANDDKDQAVKAKNEAVANFRIVSGQSKYNLIFTRTQAQMEFLMRQIDPDLAGEALILAQRAIYLSPADPRGYYLLGRMYGELGDELKAQELYRQALELKPDYGEARNAILIYEWHPNDTNNNL